MISFHFNVEPAHLVFHLLSNTAPNRFVSEQCDPEIVCFQNAAWQKDKDAYDFIRHGSQEINFIRKQSVKNLAERADALLKEMLTDPTFTPLLAETVKSLDLVRTEWEANMLKTNDMVREMTDLKLDKLVEVYLTHPKLKQGHATSDGYICWAYRLTWPNYNTVYLWHETLHLLLPGDDLEHSVIQLIADNEMRTRLNGGSYPPFEAHKEHIAMMEKLLPSWRNYLKQSKKDIHEYLRTADTIVKSNNDFQS